MPGEVVPFVFVPLFPLPLRFGSSVHLPLPEEFFRHDKPYRVQRYSGNGM